MAIEKNKPKLRSRTLAGENDKAILETKMITIEAMRVAAKV
jgi:hypothetical protein